MLIKRGEATVVDKQAIQNKSELNDGEKAMLSNFRQVTAGLKKVAPKANDFLYFVTVMMHSAEASLLNSDGTLKKDAKGKEVTAHWEKKGESWKWVCSDKNVKPYKNCFIPGTQILLEDGTTKNIEDVVVGDLVITHNNRAKKVVRTFITPHDGDLLKIDVRNGQSIFTTENHPFFKLNVQAESGREAAPKRLLREKSSIKNKEFVPASELKKSDLLLGPVLETQLGGELNCDSAKLLGLFAAEGSYSKKYNKYQGVRFTLNINEKDTLAEQIKCLLNKTFKNCSVSIHDDGANKNTCTVYATGHGVADFFRHHVGEYSEYKTLSRDLVYGSKEIKEKFILGWLEGDGHVSKDAGQVIGITVSKNLASQIKIMLNSLEIGSSLRLHKSDGQPKTINPDYESFISKDNYRIEISATCAENLIKDSEKLKFVKRGEPRHENRFFDKHALYSINEITKIQYSGNVYNFEVEDDNSYIANGLVVHNCNGDIFPEEELIKAHKKWKEKPLCIDHKSSSADHVRGIILDTYYDYGKKRVVAICALDKLSYPDLARKVATGVSSSVSMGTAVEKAICTDCGNVARVEADFCQHMKTKSGYGEVNVGLNPIELSIVVTGADPDAKIRHIIAAADSLAKYVNSKQSQISKLAEEGHEQVEPSEISQILADLEKVRERLQTLEEQAVTVKEIEEHEEHEEGVVEHAEHEAQETTEEELAEHEHEHEHDEEGSSKEDIDELKKDKEDKSSIEIGVKSSASNDYIKLAGVIGDIYKKINEIQNDLYNRSLKKETTMTEKKAYYQGGGGPNEPSPGKYPYPKEDSDSIREKKDKHLESPQDTGPVDGLFPGDEEKKRALQRLATEERAQRRKEALDKAKKNLSARKKEAYHNGGGDEYVIGKYPYPKEDAEKIRDKEDKQMVGAPPFPNVGKIDGLYGDDLKTKQMLARAKLNAKFIKSANLDGSENLADSRWQVFANDKLILSATVSDITGGRVEALYDSVASKEFGRKILNTIRVDGFDKAVSLVKGGQAAPAPAPAPMAPAAPAAPVPDASATPLPSEGDGEGAEDKGGEGAPEEHLPELLNEVETTLGKVREGVEVLTNKPGSELEGLDQLGGGAPEMPDMSGMGGAQMTTANLVVMQKKLAHALRLGFNEAESELERHAEELRLANKLVKNSERIEQKDQKHVNSLIKDACEEARNTLSECHNLMASFVRYAKGTNILVKHAQQLSLRKRAQSLSYDPEKDFGHAETVGQTQTGKAGQTAGFSAGSKQVALDHAAPDKGIGNASPMTMKTPPKAVNNPKPTTSRPMTTQPATANSADDTNYVMELDMQTGKAKGTAAEVGEAMKHSKANLNTKEGRAAWLAKLAEKGMKFSDLLDKAHPKGGVVLPNIGKPQADATMHTLEERHDAMMDVVNAPVKVKKQAEDIQKLVASGSIDPEKDFPKLIANGVDAEAVKYWKSLYGQMKDGGSQFAAELTKDHATKKAAEEKEAYRVKLARAYDTAYDMVRRGMISDTQSAVSQQVNDLMNFNDEGFESMRRFVERQPIAKQASAMPLVGYIDSDTTRIPAPEAKTASLDLSEIFKGRRY